VSTLVHEVFSCIALLIAHADSCSLVCTLFSVLQCVAVCCSVLQCAVVCCSGLQCVAVCCIVCKLLSV